jgi:glycosyltransferase involved in cell wall biosynthesis
MLKARGHTVIHYGNEASNVECDEHVTVTEIGDLGPPLDYLNFDLNSHIYKLFHRGAIAAIERRKKPRDFLLCMWGAGHRPVADAHSDMIVVEPGIGYAGGHFAPFKVFESYAILHAYYGLAAVGSADRINWYDVVIPNFFDPNDFIFEPFKDNYLLFMGRVYSGKGVHIAMQLAEHVDARLVIAGPGEIEKPTYSGIEIVGVADQVRRRELLAHAKALIAPSLFIEPFCATVTEAHFSGTPTITSDWGAFAENNQHGVTGYRCRTFEHFEWAVHNIDQIDPYACNSFAEKNFTMDRIADMYEEYFWSVMNVFTGKGWYEPNPGRCDLGWLARYGGNQNLLARV